jgi:hypothetical protein
MRERETAASRWRLGFGAAAKGETCPPLVRPLLPLYMGRLPRGEVGVRLGLHPQTDLRGKFPFSKREFELEPENTIHVNSNRGYCSRITVHGTLFTEQ